MIHDDLLKRFPSLVTAVGPVSYRKIKDQEYVRMKIQLRDGSALEVREFYDADRLEAYSYYWLAADNKLIVGWDNAPHHKSVKTFPHHRHIGDQANVADSRETSLKQVLQFIEYRLE